ncbi:MAG: hypothetical protein OEN01_01370 [Candidatus Krumholzibacteria bacterium]|nr:hypothetical protein [Candidatus Krumholzibacteria bacterium]
MRIRIGGIVGVVVLAALGLTLAAPTLASSLRADKIVRKHVKALGGKKRKAITAIRTVGRVEVRGMEISFTAWRRRPDLSRLEVNIMGFDVVQAYDGKTAWWVNPIVGATEPTEMPADYAREVLRWTDFDGPLVDYKKKRHKIKYVGRERLDTGEAYKLRIRLANGDEWHVYIDSRTYLEVKRSYTQTYQGQTSTVDTYFSDFFEVDGLTTPRVIRGVGLGGEPFIMTFDSLDTRIEADGARFDMPGRKKRRFGWAY